MRGQHKGYNTEGHDQGNDYTWETMELNEYLNYIDPAHANLCEYGDDDEHDDNEYTPDEHEAYEAQCMDDTIYWHEHNEHEAAYMMHENDEPAYYMGGRGPHKGKEQRQR